MQSCKQSKSNRLTWLMGGVTTVLILIGASCTPPAEPTSGISPAAMPTAAVAAVVPTVAPTLTPTPRPASIAVASPVNGDKIDLGQSVEFIISASDPDGIRLISLTSNGQGIGLAQGTGQETLALNQQWTPEYAGTHQIEVIATSRTGAAITADPIILSVIDQEMVARNAPIWENVEANVIDLRGLTPLEPVDPTLLSRTELRQRLQADYFLTEEEARQDVLVLHAFDFVSRSFDLYGLSRRYLGESIAGYYDPDTKEFVVVSGDNDTDALEQWTYAHEFMHALQDQHFQLDLITDASAGFEGNMPLRALAEGEAELVQDFYLDWDYFSDDELIDIFNRTNHFYQFVSDPGYFPDVLVNSFIFPYTTGRDFAHTLFTRNGWAGLNDAWENLPQSTEQILHPDRYFAEDAPQIVTLPPLTDTLGTDWTQIEAGVFGEFFLREYLIQRLDERDVDAAATGWGGDQYAVYWREGSNDLVMVLRAAWDSARDSDQFTAAFTSYAGKKYGIGGQAQPDGSACWQAGDVTCLLQSGEETLVVRAPDLETAVAIIAVIFQDVD